MKYALLFILFTQLGTAPSYARQANCTEASQDLRAIDSHLFQVRANNAECSSLTPLDVGITGTLSAERLAYFNSSRCKNLTVMEEEIAQIESRLLVRDGLVELRAQTVNRQQFIGNVDMLPSVREQAVTRFTTDVALGSLIQDTIHPTQGLVTALLEGVQSNNAQVPDWSERITNLCQRSEHRAKPLCFNWSDNPPEEVKAEFSSFLNTFLTPDNVTAQALASYNSLLTFSTPNGSTNFHQVWQRLKASDFETFLEPQEAGAPPRTPSVEQMQVVRSLNLNIPPAANNSLLAQIVTRMQNNRAKLQTSGDAEILRRSVRDNADRHLARARARWSQIWNKKRPGIELPCRTGSAREFITCATTAAADLNLEADLRRTPPGEIAPTTMMDAIINGATLAADSSEAITNCLSNGVRLADVLSPTPSNPACARAGLTEVADDEANRDMLNSIRSHIAAQQSPWLRYRQQALERLNECDDSNIIFSYDDTLSPVCLGLPARSSIAPLVRLSFDSLEIIASSVQGPTEIGANIECTTLPQALRSICSRSREAERPRPNATDDFVPGPVLRNTRTSGRNREMEAVIVSDALSGAIRSTTQSYFNNRAATDNFRNQMASYYRAPQVYQPYSGLNPGMCSGIAASVMCYGSFNLGYGTYYNNLNCPNCDFRNIYGQGFLNQAIAPALPSLYFGGGQAGVGQFGTGLNTSEVLSVGQFGQ